MTENELKRRYPNASGAFIKANSNSRDTELHPDGSQPAKGIALECIEKRESKGVTRFEIRFTIYSQRPMDWDNYHIKELQDALVRIGILHVDDWSVLQGSVISKKAHTKEEEKTVIELSIL